MTNVIKEIKTNVQPMAESVAQEVVEPVTEPKPKRAPRARAPTRKKVHTMMVQDDDASNKLGSSNTKHTGILVLPAKDRPPPMQCLRHACERGL
jgi:hypothetical protein